MRLQLIATISKKDERDIQQEIDRVCTQVVAVPLKNGKIRVMDNAYHELVPRDVDPVELYDWLLSLPDYVSLKWFCSEWEKSGPR